MPAPPGAALDLFARALVEHLSLALGQPVIVANIAGAGGLIAAKVGSRSAPDGHTLLLAHSGLLAVQTFNPRLDLLREFVPVARLVHSPLVLVVRAEAPYKTLADLFAAVRAHPGRFSYGSGGIGTPSHVAVVEIASRTGPIGAVHIPYNAASEASTAMLRGDIEFAFGVLGALLPLIESGRLCALAVTGDGRTSLLPDVPTVSEAGVPGFSLEPWAGLMAPAGTPSEVLVRLDSAVPRVLAAPAMQAFVARLGLVVAYADGPTFATQIARELAQESQHANQLGLTAPP